MVLNVLGDPAGDESLNSYHTGASNRIGFVGQAVGNVVSDEAGHLLEGIWIMDVRVCPYLRGSRRARGHLDHGRQSMSVFAGQSSRQDSVDSPVSRRDMLSIIAQ